MVEPLDMQNMLGRTPLVEKTVAAQRDDVQQQAHTAAQFAVARQHKNENVQLKRDSPRTEAKKDNPKRGQAQAGDAGGDPAPEPEEAGEVDLVSETSDEPRHRLDVTI